MPILVYDEAALVNNYNMLRWSAEVHGYTVLKYFMEHLTTT